METTENKQFIPIYNLEAMTEPQRQDYVRAVCKHLGIPDNLNLVNVGYIDDADGPRRMVTFVKRGAYEGVRANHGISTEITKTEDVGGSFVVTAVGTQKTGRKETALGAKYIRGLEGKALDDAIMTAQTRAMNRATLQFIGAGILDESEVQNRDTQVAINKTPAVIPPQPTVQVNSEVGNDVTAPTTAAAPASSVDNPPWMNPSLSAEEQQKVFVAEQEKMRAEAIASLNKQATPEVLTEGTPKEKKKRSPRKTKTVDLGLSEVPAVSAAVTPPTPTPVPVAPVAATVEVAAPVPPPAPVAVPAPTKNKLAPEVLKPFRTRQFQFVTELEQNGFAPKEGVGNLDKMRQFVGLLFPEVTNFNDLTVEQWEKYLTAVETKLKSSGPKETIKYIEEAIGV